MKRSRSLRVLHAGLAAVLLAPAGAQAAEQQARLTIDLRIQGSESASAGSDWGKGTISERYHISTTVKTDGVLSSVNSKDPEYAQKALDRAARDRQRIRAAQERAAAAGVGPKPVEPAAAEALMKEMQAAVEACGSDETCKQSVGMKYATRPDFAQAMAALSSPEYACRQQSGGDAAREAQCLAAYGIVPGKPAEEVDLDEEEPPPDERYLMYIGWIGCPSEISMQIDNRLEGAYADVAGMIPYVSTSRADWQGTEVDRANLCVWYTIVLDTKAQQIYTDGLALPEVQGTSVYSEPGRREDERFEGGISSLPSPVAEVASKALRVAPLEGTHRASVTLARPYLARAPIERYEGRVDIELSWSFEPL